MSNVATLTTEIPEPQREVVKQASNIRELFMANVGYHLAKYSLKNNDLVPTIEGVKTAMSIFFEGYNTYFAAVENDPDTGEAIWPQGKQGISKINHEYYEKMSLLAYEFLKNDTDDLLLFRSILSTIKEQDEDALGGMAPISPELCTVDTIPDIETLDQLQPWFVKSLMFYGGRLFSRLRNDNLGFKSLFKDAESRSFKDYLNLENLTFIMSTSQVNTDAKIDEVELDDYWKESLKQLRNKNTSTSTLTFTGNQQKHYDYIVHYQKMFVAYLNWFKKTSEWQAIGQQATAERALMAAEWKQNNPLGMGHVIESRTSKKVQENA